MVAAGSAARKSLITLAIAVSSLKHGMSTARRCRARGSQSCVRRLVMPTIEVAESNGFHSGVAIAALAFLGDCDHIRFHHICDQCVKACPMLPAELSSRLTRITNERVHFGRPKITRIDFDKHHTGRLLEAFLIDALPVPDNCSANACERPFNQFSNR